MIESITIRGFRGIAEGTLDELGRLTVITGTNGCGKSTVLDAMLVTHSTNAVHALNHVASRRPQTPDPLRWLLHSAADKCELVVTDNNETRSYGIRPEQSILLKDLVVRAGLGPRAEHRMMVGDLCGVNMERPLEIATLARLFDPSIPVPVMEAYSEAIRLGHRAEITELLSVLIPGFEALEILAEPGGRSFLYVTKRGEGAVPLSLSGDGIEALVQLAVSLATMADGIALIEEPEVFQHPSALHQTARILWANVGRGLQVVLTTHSLELIDALVETALADDLPHLAVFTLGLDEGKLLSSRIQGDDVRFARITMESDLR
jgi:hypothetical protein